MAEGADANGREGVGGDGGRAGRGPGGLGASPELKGAPWRDGHDTDPDEDKQRSLHGYEENELMTIQQQ